MSWFRSDVPLAAALFTAMNAVCDPLIDSVIAPIRSAMNRSASGGIALSAHLSGPLLG